MDQAEPMTLRRALEDADTEGVAIYNVLTRNINALAAQPEQEFALQALYFESSVYLSIWYLNPSYSLHRY